MNSLSIIQSIEQLIFTHDCVIIPNFGGFVVNQQGYTYDAQEAKIHPKKRWIAFNERLRADDGILAMQIAKDFGLSQKKAFEQVVAFSTEIKSLIQANGSLEFGKLGQFSLTNEQKISFSPNGQMNFDLTQYGLFEVGTLGKPKPKLIENPIPQSVEDQPTITQAAFEQENTTKSFSSRFYAYVITAFILGGLGAYVLTEPNSKFVSSSFSPLTIKIKKEKVVAKPIVQPKEIKSANPEPKVEPVTEPIPEAPKVSNANGIYLVAASFKTQERAEKGVAEFVSKGFDSVEILPKKEGEQYYRVSVGKVENMDEGYQAAAMMKKSKQVDIWVYQTNH
jgi:nucleoid DNA-binding protein